MKKDYASQAQVKQQFQFVSFTVHVCLLVDVIIL
jgi:hypothetical protein